MGGDRGTVPGVARPGQEEERLNGWNMPTNQLSVGTYQPITFVFVFGIKLCFRTVTMTYLSEETLATKVER